MSATLTAERGRVSAPRALTIGVVGGIVGGMVFGMLMAMQDMLPMIAALVGSDSAAVGFGVHLAISAGAGLLFGAAVAAVPTLVATPLIALAAGALYGVAWWIAGALVAMPLMLGMSQMVLVIEQTQVMSLMGHVVFGIVTALVVYVAARR
jgi:hypothetical protein